MPELQFGYLITAFVAGVLTILSPCVLPMLPIVISGSVDSKSLYKPLRIIGALAVSVTVFSLLLKVSTVFLGVPDYVWRWLSGSILIVFGILLFKPNLWQTIVKKIGADKSTHKFLSHGLNKGGVTGDLLVGASLGPVFTSCSPTYLIIVAVILPQSWGVGLIYLLFFVLGLSLILVLIALLGQKFVSKLAIFNDPKSWFKPVLAAAFVIIGLLIFTGYDKKIEAFLIKQGLYNWMIDIEGELPSS